MTRLHVTDAAIAAVVLVGGLFAMTGRPSPSWHLASAPPPAVAREGHNAELLELVRRLDYLPFSMTWDGVRYQGRYYRELDETGMEVIREELTADGVAIAADDLPPAVRAERDRWVAWSITTTIRDRRVQGGGTA